MKLLNWICGHDYSQERMVMIAPFTDFSDDATVIRRAERAAKVKRAIKTLGKKYCLYPQKSAKK